MAVVWVFLTHNRSRFATESRFRPVRDRLAPLFRNLAVAKTLCDWKKKEIERNRELLAELVSHPRYLCKKCARAAAVSKVLCKPSSLKRTPAKSKEEASEKARK